MRAPILAFLLLAPWPASAGEVEGVVRFTGPAPARRTATVTKDRAACGEEAADESLLVSEGGLANVVVRLVVPGAKAEPRRVSLDQRGCRFVPHVLVAPAGSTLDLLNGDPVLHGVHGWSGVATAFNLPLPGKGPARSHLLARTGTIRVGCDIHGWMSAWIVVVEGPHFAVSDERGRFTIAGVPPGTFTAIAWHERLGERIATVTVPAEGGGTLAVAYP